MSMVASVSGAPELPLNAMSVPCENGVQEQGIACKGQWAPVPLRVGFIGAGAIATTAIKVLLSQPQEVMVVGVFSRSGFTASLADALHPNIQMNSVAALLNERPDVIVECASREALREYAPAVLNSGVTMLATSVSAMADPAFQVHMQDCAQRSGATLRVVSGATAGLDWLTAAMRAGLDEVVYRIRKPPAAWPEQPEAQQEKGALAFYRATVRRAAESYPKNVNAAATVALATIGFDRTILELISDPGSSSNIHEIEAHGPAGTLTLQVNNAPEPGNPRTSLITGYSVADALLRRQGLSIAKPH